jgi:hypothetical protein
MGLLDVDAGKRLWVAAAPREDAVALVLGAMPEGWSAAPLDTRLKPDEVVLLNTCASAI